jgi:hypothetical protein
MQHAIVHLRCPDAKMISDACWGEKQSLPTANPRAKIAPPPGVTVYMRLIVVMLTALFVCGSAAAEGWREYTYPEFSFAINFPADPKVQRTTYTTIDGASVPARTYSLERDGKLYSVTVADFSRTGLDEKSVFEQAIRTLAEHGELKEDVLVLLDKNIGHQLSFSGTDGSHSNVALYFYQHRLYQAQGVILPSNGDLSAGDGIRFMQSLHFTNNASNSFGLGSTFGATGHF